MCVCACARPRVFNLFVVIISLYTVSCIFYAPSYWHLIFVDISYYRWKYGIVGKRFPFRWWRRWLWLGWWLQWWWNTSVAHWWGWPLCFLCGYNQRYNLCDCFFPSLHSLSLEYIKFGRLICGTHLLCQPFVSSFASIRSIEVPEPYTNARLPFSSTSQWCCSARGAETSWDRERKVGKGISCQSCFLIWRQARSYCTSVASIQFGYSIH